MPKLALCVAFSFLTIGLLFNAPVHGQGQIKEIVKRMNNHQKLLKTVKADVERAQTNAQLRTVDKYEGELAMIPGEGSKLAFRLDWKTENGRQRSETVSVVNGKYVLLQPGIKRATYGSSESVKSTKVGSSAFGALNMSERQLRANYESPQYIGEETLKDGTKAWHLKLTPKAKQGFKSVDIWIDKDGMPRQAMITAPNSDTDTFLLTRIRKNETIKVDTFSISIPRGFKAVKN